MGCDGGSIPRRDEMVKLKKKAEKADKVAELAAKWKYCALSGEGLTKPIVACDLGCLYNKESLLLALLDKPNLPDVAKHIRTLRDVVELNLTPNPTYKPAAMAMAEANQAAEYVCPVSGLEMSGRHRFVFLRQCGCVLSERALKEVPSDSCHRCGRGYTKDSVIVLNGTEEEVKRQREAMEQRRLEAKQAKLAAKGKRKKDATTGTVSTTQPPSTTDSNSSSSPPSITSTSSTEEGATPSPPAEKRQKLSPEETSTAPLTNGSAKTSKLKKQDLPKGASKYSRQTNAPSSKIPSSSGSEVGRGSAASSVVKKAAEELGNTFKAPAVDTEARAAYKSLFHSTSKPHPKERTSNWVTFFPYH